jgi:pimeloyl-ACP methyl ester carboxylesterase
MLTNIALAVMLAAQSVDSGRTASGLWYEVRGAGPNVVLVHGANLDSRGWGTLPAALASTHRVTLMDLRSHGRSGDATGPFSWMDDVVSVLNAVRARDAVLIGHSLGAQVVLDLALAHPERVRGLILIGPAISGKRLVKPPEGFESLVTALRAGDFPQAGVALAAMPVMTLRRDTSASADVRRIVSENVRLFRASQPWIQPLDPPAVQRLESMPRRVLVLMGELDPTESNDAGKVLLDRLPNATGETFAGCGHLIPLDCPTESSRAVLSFLRGLGQRHNPI